MNFLKILLLMILINIMMGFELELEDLPEEFDLRKNYTNTNYKCKSFDWIKDQGKLGSCWAFSAAGVINDRICIGSKGKNQTIVSVTELITCCRCCCTKDENRTCDGGSKMFGFIYWVQYGLPSESCKPYPFKFTEGKEIKCNDTCNDGTEPIFYQGSDWKYIEEDEIKIKNEIYFHGSVSASFSFYSDFNTYWNEGCKGVYKYNNKEPQESSHSVKIIGWGKENGEKYWLCVNSWGTEYCGGVFKMGIDQCGIMSSIWAADTFSDVKEKTKESIIVFQDNFFSFKNLDKDFR